MKVANNVFPNVLLIIILASTLFLSFIRAESEVDQVNQEELYEEELLLNHLNSSGLLNKMKIAKSLKIYIAKHISGFIFHKGDIISKDGLFPGPLLNLSRSGLPLDLYPIQDWLHIHTEYSADAYVFLRLKSNNFMIVTSSKKADLCFAYCDDDYMNVPRIRNQFPIFVVPRGKENNSFFNCDVMGFGFEDEIVGVHPDCSVTAPYVSSIYSPNGLAIAPWNLPLSRTNLLVFFGGVWRGERRKEIVQEMETYSKLHRNNTFAHFDTYFLAPKKILSHNEEDFAETFFAEAWSTYAHSYFSWQPPGDTLTRRAFYDSWLFGCIPVISTKSAWVYKLLFKKHLFMGKTFIFEDIVVVLEHHVYTNGALTLEHLSKIPMEELKRRQSGLRSIAPLMQWGWETKHRIDPLLLVLATLMK